MNWFDWLPYKKYGNILTHGKLLTHGNLARQTVDVATGIVWIISLHLTKTKYKQDFYPIDVVCEFNSTQRKETPIPLGQMFIL